MGYKKILAVGVQLPEVESVPFDSNKSLLDADIVFYYPCLNRKRETGEYYSGSSFNVRETSQVQARLYHWREEIEAVLRCGKLVVVPLVRPILHTGQALGSYGLTESIISSYDALPAQLRPEIKEGTQMKLSDGPNLLTKYWKCFQHNSKYEVVLEGGFGAELLRTRTGDRVVAALAESPGTMVLVPGLNCKGIAFGSWHGPSKSWTAEALTFVKKLTGVLSEMYDDVNEEHNEEPPPDWTLKSAYTIEAEEAIATEIKQAQDIIVIQEQTIATLSRQKADAGEIRALLYEQGKPLERAVRRALVALGFEATGFSDGESEFDAVFESTEGRCLGEVEGKDNSSIAIDKFSQLERNVNEDLQREEVSNPAKGVLFGNAHRLLQLHERGEYFTAKCIQAARRTRVALVRTPDLFVPARYLLAHASPDYAAACRRAILEAEGSIVSFPAPPIQAPFEDGPISQSAAEERAALLRGPKNEKV